MKITKKIYYILGKSASGKDTVYQRLICDERLKLKKIIPYTTRPIREGERDGKEYFFCNDQRADALMSDGKIIELREYQTVYGLWKYFTVYDDQFDEKTGVNGYLMIGTLEGFINVSRYFGRKSVIPIYIEVEDGQRLRRAIEREQRQVVPGYEEVCRRFLADSKDFSEQKLAEANIENRFENIDLDECIEKIRDFIIQSM